MKYILKKLKKRGNQIKKGDNEYKLSDPSTRKNEINENLKNVEYKDLEDMVFRMELTYSEIEKIIDLKYIATSTIGYTLQPVIYESSDINLMVKNLLPDEVKVIITIDDIRLKSSLTNNKTISFTEKPFFYTIIGYT